MTEKITLNLSEYRPYRKMGQSCQLKDIAEFNVHWPIFTTASNLADNDLNVRYMRGNDIDEIVQLWKNVYPEAYGSTHQFVFSPQWYEGNVLVDENWDQNLQIEFTMGGLHSAFREKKVFYPFFKNILDTISETEVELITVFAETWHKKTQELMDSHGFKIWGIFPGNMIRWSHDQKCYRACEVHYYKFVNAEGGRLCPQSCRHLEKHGH